VQRCMRVLVQLFSTEGVAPTKSHMAWLSIAAKPTAGIGLTFEAPSSAAAPPRSAYVWPLLTLIAMTLGVTLMPGGCGQLPVDSKPIGAEVWDTGVLGTAAALRRGSRPNSARHEAQRG